MLSSESLALYSEYKYGGGLLMRCPHHRGIAVKYKYLGMLYLTYYAVILILGLLDINIIC